MAIFLAAKRIKKISKPMFPVPGTEGLRLGAFP
jgi:hypothetical protein